MPRNAKPGDKIRTTDDFITKAFKRTAIPGKTKYQIGKFGERPEINPKTPHVRTPVIIPKGSVGVVSLNTKVGGNQILKADFGSDFHGEHVFQGDDFNYLEVPSAEKEREAPTPRATKPSYPSKRALGWRDRLANAVKLGMFGGKD